MSSECTICRTEWTSSGDHRVISLRCGHLYGRKCIYEWLNRQQSCPLCNLPCKKEEVRVLYLEPEAVKNCAISEVKKEKQRSKRKVERIYESIKKERNESTLLKKKYKNIQNMILQSIHQNKSLDPKELEKLIDTKFQKFEYKASLHQDQITSFDFLNDSFDIILLVKTKLYRYNILNGLSKVEELKDLDFYLVHFNLALEEIVLVGKEIFLYNQNFKEKKRISIDSKVTCIAGNEELSAFGTESGHFLIFNRKKDKSEIFSLTDKSPVISIAIGNKKEVYLSQGIRGLYYFDIKDGTVKKIGQDYTLSISFDKHLNRFLYSTINYSSEKNTVRHYVINGQEISFLFEETSTQQVSTLEKIGVIQSKGVSYQSLIFSSLDYGDSIDLEDEEDCFYTINYTYVTSIHDDKIYLYDYHTKATFQEIKADKSTIVKSLSCKVGNFFAFKNENGIHFYAQRQF